MNLSDLDNLGLVKHLTMQIVCDRIYLSIEGSTLNSDDLDCLADDTTILLKVKGKDFALITMIPLHKDSMAFKDTIKVKIARKTYKVERKEIRLFFKKHFIKIFGKPKKDKNFLNGLNIV